MFTIYRNVVISYSGYSLGCITFAACYALVCFGVFHYVRSRLLARAGADLHHKLRSKVFKGLIETNVVAGNRAYSQGMADIGTLREFFASQAVYPLFDLPWAPFYLLLIFFIHPVLGLIAFLGAAFVLGLGALQEFLIRGSMTDANRWNAKNQRFVNAFLRNTEVINGMGMTEAVADWFDRNHDRVISNQTQSSKYAGAIQSVIKPMQNVIQVLIYCAGAYYAMLEGFSVGLMVAASIIMGRGLAPIMQATSSWKFIVQARQAYQRVQSFEKKLDARIERMELPEIEGRVSSEGATYVSGGRPLVANVSFVLASGEFMGILGPSGAGKTTLCKLILGVWPCSAGRVSLDGMDSFLWNKESAGKKIGYLPQEVELFPATVAENIARLGEVDMEEVQAAVEICGIQPLIESLPAGYDTYLETEGGVKLSGGQKQIIGMAMALYGNPSLLILDEPTSNLDEQAEAVLMKALANIQQKKKTTCIMVTHKPELLRAMDKILVMKQGRVARFGPKNEVFAELAGQNQQQAKEAI